MLFLFVSFCHHCHKLPKTQRADIAFPHMGVGKNTVDVLQAFFETTDSQTPCQFYSYEQIKTLDPYSF